MSETHMADPKPDRASVSREELEREERRKRMEDESAREYRRFADSIKRTSQDEMDKALRGTKIAAHG